MISHDTTLLISALVDAGGEADENVLRQQLRSRLAGSYAAARNLAIDRGLVVQHLSLTAERLTALKLTNPKKYFKAVPRESLSALISGATDRRNFHFAYQQVLAGESARSDPVKKYAAKLSAIDRPDFWRAWEVLSEAEKKDFRSRIARLVD